MLSKRAKYGLKALVRLGREARHEPMLISELAAKERIPRKFLEAILLDLKNQGVLDSRRGKGGGYLLAKPPERILLGDVIRRLEGPLALVPCASVTAYRPCDDCVDERSCGIRLVMKEVRDATARILDRTTLADLLRRSRDARRGH